MKTKIKQDINFLEYPLWMQDKQSEKGIIWSDREGFTYKTGWKAPVKLDLIFLYYLLIESQQRGWTQEIELSQYECLKGCGIQPGKHWRTRLQDGLERWMHVVITFEGVFYNGNEHINGIQQFHILEHWEYLGKTKKLKIRFTSKWIEQIQRSTYFKVIDFEQIKALRSPLATRLYEILSKSFQNRRNWSCCAHKLAQKIPMKEQYPAHIVPKVKTAINQINEKTNLSIKVTIRRPERGKAIFDFEKQEVPEGNGKTAAPPSLKVVDVPQELEESLEALLELLPKKERGKKTLRELLARKLRKHDFAFVRRNILYANKNAKSNYRTYLNKALKEDWGEGYEEDLTHARELAEAQRQAEELRKLQEEQERLLEAKIAQMARHKLSTLSQEQREERQAQAEAFISEGFPNLVGSSFFEGAVSQQLEIAMRQEIRDLLSKSREGS